MSKRKAEPSRRLQKRRKGGIPAFGAENEDDRVSLASGVSTASAFSTRSLLSTGTIPNLSALCARSFVTNLQASHGTRDDWENTFKWLNCLPDYLVPRMFAMLRSTCPQILTSAMITSVCIILAPWYPAHLLLVFFTGVVHCTDKRPPWSKQKHNSGYCWVRQFVA
jgi:hypothetical protein